MKTKNKETLKIVFIIFLVVVVLFSLYKAYSIGFNGSLEFITYSGIGGVSAGIVAWLSLK